MRTQPSPLQRGVLSGLAVFRTLATIWMVIVVVVTRHELRHAWAALGLCVLVAAMTAGLATLGQRRPDILLHPLTVGSELAVGGGLLVADSWAYETSRAQSLGSAWPLAGVLSAGVAGGPIGGIAAGFAIGCARWLRLGLESGGDTLSPISSTVLYVLAGGAAGLVMRQLRNATDEIAEAKAREEVARTLHDGVLQTLAVVQRRSEDPEIAALAQRQERELRQYLFGIKHPSDDLITALRKTANHATDRYGIEVELGIVEEPSELSPQIVEAFSKAVGEALTNAAKHGDAARAVVLIDVDEQLLSVSINDSGSGFDPIEIEEGVGLGRSIRGRIEQLGGSVEVTSVRGRGTEITLSLPIPTEGER